MDGDSCFEKEQCTLDNQGPDPNYLIAFKDPDNKINSILGLTQETLDLALEVSEIGSIDAFVTAEELSETNKIAILLENGFQITLVERALAGINITEVGDIDSQRLYMFVALSVQIVEEKENNRAVLGSSYDFTRQHSFFEFERWMSRIFDEDFPDNSYLYVYLKPKYSSSDTSSSLREILPGLKFYIREREPWSCLFLIYSNA